MAAVFDLIVQRVIEVLQSMPSIPLWMALAAIMPVTWSPILIYFGITIILGMLDWTGLARAVRSKLLALREEDYVLAAQLMGARSQPHHRAAPHSRLHVAFDRHRDHFDSRHDLGRDGVKLSRSRPQAAHHELGILLTEARSVSVIAFYPWLLFPMIPVILVILAFNFLGDGLRDAADPYK